MELKQVRECDGACCKEAPRFPNEDNTDCIYRTNSDKSKGCSLMLEGADLDSLPISPAQPNKSGKQCFMDTCANWPHAYPNRGTGGCCWQWTN